MGIKINLNGRRCDSLEDIRDNFNFEELQTYHIDGDLHQWLAEHSQGYNAEATLLADIPTDDESVLWFCLLSIFFKEDQRKREFVMRNHLSGFLQKVVERDCYFLKKKYAGLSGVLNEWESVVKNALVAMDSDGAPMGKKKSEELIVPTNKLVEMVKVEGGSFVREENKVSLDTFYIGKYPVTQRQWREITGKNPSNFLGDNLPVERVSWYDAVCFCNALSKWEGFEPCYLINREDVKLAPSAVGYRLPTEAEWEYAARGGIQSRGYQYAGSDYMEIVGWYDGNSEKKTHEVGRKNANELGLYDMSGNVWEWCWDWRGDYYSSVQVNPLGAATGSYRVYRGGGWGSSAGNCAVSCRSSSSPDYASSTLGFCLVFASSSK